MKKLFFSILLCLVFSTQAFAEISALEDSTGKRVFPWKIIHNCTQTFRNGVATLNCDSIDSYTVGTLPLGTEGEIAVVTDGASTSDCTAGGGASVVMCRKGAVAWAAMWVGGTVLASDTLWAAAGDLAYATANDAADVLTIGTAGQMLVVSGGLPAWSSSLTGTFDLGDAVASGHAVTMNASGELQTAFDALLPDAADGATIGSASYEWSDLYLADGGVIYGQNDQSATLTSGASLWTANNFASAGYLAVGTDPADAGTIRLPNAGTIIWEDGTEAAITHVDNTGWTFGAVAIMPETNNTQQLGSTTLMWADLFLGDGAVVNFNNGDVTVTHSENTLTFAGASSGYVFDAAISNGTATDPYIKLDETDGTDWWIGVDDTGNSLEFRTNATVGNTVRMELYETTGLLVTPPSAQTISAGNTVTADACGTIKMITAAGAVTTDTTNTFTAPAATNAGCCMDVINVGAENITLDNNALFVSAGAADVVLGAGDTVRVCSTGASGKWYQIGATGNN